MNVSHTIKVCYRKKHNVMKDIIWRYSDDEDTCESKYIDLNVLEICLVVF